MYQYFIFLLINNILLYGYTTFDGHLVCFLCLDLMNNPAMNIYAQVFV